MKVLLRIVICVYSLLPDQTPTPTRFLKNCEEVGLFNELASSFEQDDDDKRAKNSVRQVWSWWFWQRLHLCVHVSVWMTVYRNQGNFLPTPMKWKITFFTSFFLASSVDVVKIYSLQKFLLCACSLSLEKLLQLKLVLFNGFIQWFNGYVLFLAENSVIKYLHD